jgi:hypothetical protein
MEYPILAFKVRRQHLLQDTLREVSALARFSFSAAHLVFQLSTKDPRDFRKSLKVQFVGEEAIDQGT